MPAFSESRIFKEVSSSRIPKFVECPGCKVPLASAPFDQIDCGYAAVCPKCYKGFAHLDEDEEED